MTRTRKPKKNKHAVALGKLGRAVNSPAQVAAARKNGKKGGRPALRLVAPEKCVCGQPIPWHMIEIAGDGFTYNCRQLHKLGKGCGRAWKWQSPTSVLRTTPAIPVPRNK